MIRRRRPPKQKPKSSFDLLSNPLAGLYLSDLDFEQHARKFLFEYDEPDFNERLGKFLRNPKFRSTFNAYGRSVEELGSRIRLPDNLPFSRTLSVYGVIFKDQANELNIFAKYRSEFEKYFLRGEYKAADSFIEKIKTELGESLWYIRHKILVLVYQDKLDELTLFCEEIKGRQSNKLINYLIDRLYVLNQKTQTAKQLNSLLVSEVKELRQASSGAFADFLAFTFAPDPLIQRTDYRNCLPCFSLLTLVDQYSALIDLVPRIIVEEGEYRASLEESRISVRFMQHLATFIDDAALCTFEHTDENSLHSINLVEESILNSYELGQYREAIRIFGLNANELSNPTMFVNIIAKCLAYEKDNSLAPVGLLGELATKVALLYTLSGQISSVYDEILATVVRCRGLTINIDFQLLIYKAAPFRFNDSDLKFAARLASRREIAVSPLVYRMAKCNSLMARYLYDVDHDSSKIYYRAKKQEIAKLALESSPDEAMLAKLEEFRLATPLQKDYYELLAEYFILKKDAQGLISIAASALSIEPNSFICFPMESLVREIEAECLASVDAVIVCYFYSKNISSKKDYVLNESFEDFLSSRGASTPSELFNNLEVDEAKYKLFFDKICTTDVMDFLSCFKSSNELRVQRLLILDHLQERGFVKVEDQHLEINNLLGQFITEASTTEINGNKIFVDTDAIRMSLLEDVDSLLSIYKISDEPSGEGFVRAPSISEEERRIVTGDKNTTLFKIITEVRRKFLIDEKHGLDKNLSAEIRHGFFENLMRSRLEKAHLLTELNDRGDYESNWYWREKNVFLTKRTLNDIDSHLKWFSGEFNKLIDQAENWMQITTQQLADKPDSPIFEFSLQVGVFEAIQSFAEKTNDAAKLIDFISEKLWERTEFCLTLMREKLNAVFKIQVDNLFEELVKRINVAKGGAAVLDLMNAIIQARSGIKEDIATVVEWFKRNVNPYTQDHSLMVLVEIAVRCFKKVKNFTHDMEVSLPQEFLRAKLPGAGLKPCVIAIMNLFDNCFKRSGFGPDTKVRIQGYTHGSGLKICISNPLTQERVATLTPATLADIRTRMTAPESISLMRVEGGSGIGKAYNHFKMASSKFALEIDMRGSEFCADIIYEN